jgi:hypothetical protein
MSIRNLPGGKRWTMHKADLNAICEPRKCGSLITQLYGPAWYVTGMASIFFNKYPGIQIKINEIRSYAAYVGR